MLEATAAIVLDQIPTWLANYNAVAPRSAPGFQALRKYRKTMSTAGPMSSLKCLTHRGAQKSRVSPLRIYQYAGQCRRIVPSEAPSNRVGSGRYSQVG